MDLRPGLVAAACGAVLAAGVATVASGAARPVDEGVATIRTAAATLQDAGTYRMSLVMTVTGPGVGYSVVGSGAFDQALHRATFTESVRGRRVDLRGDGDVVYVHLPACLRPRAGGKEWGSYTVPGGVPAAQGVADPLALLRALGSSGHDVTVVGREDVRHTPTTHYQGDLGAAALLGVLPAQLRSEQAGRVLAALAGSGVPVDVWIADDGTVRRAALRLDAPPQSVFVTMETYGFGDHLAVAVPRPGDAARLARLADLLRLAAGEGC